MTERENQTRLNEIRARLSAATPGPWQRAEDCTNEEAERHEHGWRHAPCFDIISDAAAVISSWGHDADGVIALAEDATFIANAPSDIEWLLSEVERLEKS